MEFIDNIYKAIQSNQLLAAGLGVTSAGLVSFWIKKYTTVSLYLFKKRVNYRINSNKSKYSLS